MKNIDFNFLLLNFTGWEYRQL